MNRNMIGVWICAAALAMLLPTTHPAPATAAKEWKVPEAAQGFAGKIEGEILATDEMEYSLVLKVKRVVSEAKESKAQKADKLKGEKALIYALRKYKDGKLVVDENQAQFIRTVRKGEMIVLTVRTDGSGRLRMTDVPQSPGQAAPEPDEFPARALGFAGMLEGRIIAKEDTGTTFLLKVVKAQSVPKYAEWNKAKKPEALHGKIVQIHVRWFEDPATKKFKPGEDYVQWVKRLKPGDPASVDIFSDPSHRLVMVEPPKAK